MPAAMPIPEAVLEAVLVEAPAMNAPPAASMAPEHIAVDYPPEEPRAAAISLSTAAPRRIRPTIPRPMAAVVASWALTVLVLISLGWGAVHWRDDVMNAWPPSERAYAALGLR
jgi:hypothetical protein